MFVTACELASEHRNNKKDHFFYYFIFLSFIFSSLLLFRCKGVILFSYKHEQESMNDI